MNCWIDPYLSTLGDIFSVSVNFMTGWMMGPVLVISFILDPLGTPPAAFIGLGLGNLLVGTMLEQIAFPLYRYLACDLLAGLP